MKKLVIEDMDTQHLVNRIAWCERQKIDTWAVHGVDPNVLGFLGLLQVRTLWRN